MAPFLQASRSKNNFRTGSRRFERGGMGLRGSEVQRAPYHFFLVFAAWGGGGRGKSKSKQNGLRKAKVRSFGWFGSGSSQEESNHPDPQRLGCHKRARFGPCTGVIFALEQSRALTFLHVSLDFCGGRTSLDRGSVWGDSCSLNSATTPEPTHTHTHTHTKPNTSQLPPNTPQTQRPEKNGKFLSAYLHFSLDFRPRN